ncbi:unnamed protein product [Adineta ricciae]|uniref:G-protein coupled receptors family 1 profile domain-containing protein n=1 Tax=Adineta ricciae TaxID=249248 RepID=A0A814P312_ADIRI|nr:unnamed protein product [Adineta ricciae]
MTIKSVAAYYSLFLVVVGTTMNLLTLIILLRPVFRHRKLKPTIYYMRVIVVFDILMLYGWNLDHYLSATQGFSIQRLSIPVCRLMSFLNYFAPQSSAWLRVFACIDRYFIVSRPHETWLSSSKNIFIIITCLLSFLTVLNCQFFILGCSYSTNGTISVFSPSFKVYPLWDYINLGFYNCLPFIFMVLFNSGVIYYLSHLYNINVVQHRSVSVTLIITTFLFLAMTVPATVAFAFFSTANSALLTFLDSLLYTYHITSFPLYLITFGDFQREFCKLFTCHKNNRQVLPHLIVQYKKPINVKNKDPP